MGVKKALIGAALGIAGLLGGVSTCNYYAGDKRIVNYAYCTARNIFNDFDREEIVEIPIAVYYDGFLQREDIDRCYNAYSMAEDEMLRQFGIKFNMIDSGARGLPENISMFYLREIGSREASINLYCVSRIYQQENECNIGLSSLAANSIQVVARMETEEVRDVMLHEIGHLFYAEHTDDERCYMHYRSTTSPLQWCDEERETIEKYKVRLW
ncbi:MAG: hypothetical protein PHO02_05995 [Candidatus Nanoarchaeia archaeon]|nr:hypothetical protein [Candidatus Nanoarchaeia archaeon]